MEKAYFIKIAYITIFAKGIHEKRQTDKDKIRDKIKGLAENGYKKIFVSLVQKGSIRLAAPTHISSELQSGHKCIVPVVMPLTVKILFLTQSLQNCVSQAVHSQ